ncbi:lipase family protein [Mastigocladopsis repens]|uniref:lipase family protein n=1 Tax=Mastigocladopsis repens TaxID=221287 RepID=UPI0002F02670|nr:hypothetical protein [Mastigocladopsis repens]
MAAKVLSSGLAPRQSKQEAVRLGKIPTESFKASVSHLGAEALAKASYETSADTMALPSGYRMAEKFNDPRTGLAVTVFVSPKGKPVVAFRGTEFGSGDLRDILSDVDPRGIGFGQFEGSKQALSALAAKYPSVTVTGHSLGGAIAQRYAAEFGAGEVVTFNCTFIEHLLLLSFETKKG